MSRKMLRLFLMCFVLLLLNIVSLNIVSAQPRPINIPPALPQAGNPDEQFSLKRLPNGEFAAPVFAEKVVTESSGIPYVRGTKAPPTNDSFAAATLINTLPYTTTVTAIEEATIEANHLPFCSGLSQDVWFKLELASAATVDILLMGSNYDSVLSLHSGLPTAASQEDLSLIRCNDDAYFPYSSFRASGLSAVSLNAGTYYLQISKYGSSTPTPGTELKLEVKASGGLLPFKPYTPYNYTYAAAPRVYRWYPTVNALTYNFVMTRTAGAPMGEVFALNNLTPASDADALSCTPETYQCILALPPANIAQITDASSYSWNVTASGSAGTIGMVDEYNYAMFSTLFSLLPLGSYLYSTLPTLIAPPDVLEWSASVDATSYNFTADRTAPVAQLDVIALTGLTAATDADGLACDDLYCEFTLTDAQKALITDNATYDWSVDTVNVNGTTPSSPRTFVYDTTPAPIPFNIYSPSDYLVEASESFYIEWSVSSYATTYNFSISRTAPVAAADLITLNGLTAASDTDALSCSFYCYAYLQLTPAQIALLTDGTYTNTVTAVNTVGSVVASNAPEEFIINSALAFDLFTPESETEFANGAAVPTITWEDVSGGTVVVDTYYFTLGSSYAPYYPGYLRNLTPIADMDALNCAGGVCVLNATGTRLGLNRNRYSWGVSASGTVDGNGFSISDISPNDWFTVGNVPTSFYLTNEDFETYDTTTKMPTDWTVKGVLTGSKVKCDKPTKTFSYYGACAWVVKGSPTGGSISQNLPVENLIPGDTITMYGYLQGKGVTADKAKVQMKVKYTDGTKEKITIAAPAGNSVYTYLTDSNDVDSALSKISVKVSNTSAGGKVNVDSLWVYPILSNSAIAAAPLAPLPLPLQELPSSNGRSGGQSTGSGNGRN